MNLPSYETVRDETRAAMQRVMDQFPSDAPAAFLPDSNPFGCQDGGVFYTGRAGSVQQPDFDGQEFIRSLPAALGDDFAVESGGGVATSFPAVNLIASAYGDTGMSVLAVTKDGSTSVTVTATSRCAQPPAT